MSHVEPFSLPEALLESSLAFLEVAEAVHCLRASRFLTTEAAPMLNRLSILWGRRRYKRLWEASFRSVQTSNNAELSPYAALMVMLGQERTLLVALTRITDVVIKSPKASTAASPVMSNELAKWCAPLPHVLLLLHALSEGTNAPTGDPFTLMKPFQAWLAANGSSGVVKDIHHSAPFVWHLATTEATVAKWKCLLEEGTEFSNTTTDAPAAVPVSPTAARSAVVDAAVSEADAGNTDEDVLVAALRLVEQKGGIGEGMALLAAWRDPSAGMDTLQPIVAEVKRF